MLDREITFDRFIRGLIFMLIAGALIFLLSFLSSVLAPFFIAWFIAYLIYPVVHFIQYRLHFRSRILSIFVTLALLVGLVYAFCAITIPQVTAEVEQFKVSALQFIRNGSGNQSISPQVEEFFREQSDKLQLERYVNEQNIIELVKETLPRVWKVVYETAGVLIAIISSCIAILYLFFILCDYEKLSHGVIQLFPKSKRTFFHSLLSDLQQGMSSYFRGQALIALCVGILFSIGLTIIDFPLAIPLGLFIGALSFVPYLHALGLIPIVLFSLFKAADTGQNFWIILACALGVFLVVQIIQDTILTPRIMGNAMGLPPFLILLSLSVWGYALGIIGMIIALPMTTLVISYYKRYVTKESSSDDKT